jgi:uncharacterized protein
VTGPEQVKNAIANNPVISQQFTLLGQQGSSVIQGGMQLIPINNSLLYIRPIYVQGASGSQLPAFRYIVVWYANRTVIDTSLDGALQQLFGNRPPPTAPGQTGNQNGNATTPTTTPPGQTGGGGTGANATVTSLLQQATALFNDAQNALQNKDLARYQNDVNQIGRLLAQAQALAGSAAPTTPTTPAPAAAPNTATTRPGTTSTSTSVPSA